MTGPRLGNGSCVAIGFAIGGAIEWLFFPISGRGSFMIMVIPGRNDMDRLQAMTAFVRVVENGSFSGAARQLRIGQPAVSKTIAQLEDRLQVRLLARSTHGLTPTEAGQRFYERARRAVLEVEEAELEARGAGAGLSGRLRVSAAPTFARLHLIPCLPAFLEQNPELDIDVILDDRVV